MDVLNVIGRRSQCLEFGERPEGRHVDGLEMVVVQVQGLQVG